MKASSINGFVVITAISWQWWLGCVRRTRLALTPPWSCSSTEAGRVCTARWTRCRARPPPACLRLSCTGTGGGGGWASLSCWAWPGTPPPTWPAGPRCAWWWGGRWWRSRCPPCPARRRRRAGWGDRRTRSRWPSRCLTVWPPGPGWSWPACRNCRWRRASPCSGTQTLHLLLLLLLLPLASPGTDSHQGWAGETTWDFPLSSDWPALLSSSLSSRRWRTPPLSAGWGRPTPPPASPAVWGIWRTAGLTWPGLSPRPPLPGSLKQQNIRLHYKVQCRVNSIF